MSNPLRTSSPAVEPIAIPSNQVGAALGLGDISAASRARLKRLGHWPPEFTIGYRQFVLVSDIQAFIQRRLEQEVVLRAQRQAKGRRAVMKRLGHSSPSEPAPAMAAAGGAS